MEEYTQFFNKIRNNTGEYYSEKDKVKDKNNKKAEEYVKKIHDEIIEKGVVNNPGVNNIIIYMGKYNEKDYSQSDIIYIDQKVKNYLGTGYTIERGVCESNAYNIIKGYGRDGYNGDESKDYVFEYHVKW